MKRVWLGGLFALMLSPAVAGAEATRSFYGSNARQPTFERPGFDEPAPFDYTTMYTVQPFQLDADGICTVLSVQEDNFDAAIFLYIGSFDPDIPEANLIASSDDAGDPYGVGVSEIPNIPLGSGQDYYLVTAGFELIEVGQFTNQVYCTDPVTKVIAADGNLPEFDGTYVELLDSRFRVSITWEDFAGNTGRATSVPMGSTDSALFWIFEPSNFEVLVKLVDGCGFNERYWVYLAATTNIDFTVRIRDQVTGTQYLRHNPLGTKTFTDLTDITAFEGCPQP